MSEEVRRLASSQPHCHALRGKKRRKKEEKNKQKEYNFRAEKEKGI